MYDKIEVQISCTISESFGLATSFSVTERVGGNSLFVALTDSESEWQ